MSDGYGLRDNLIPHTSKTLVTQSLTASRIKIARAKTFIMEVESIVDSIILNNIDPIKINNDLGRVEILIFPPGGVPLDLATRAGDAIHNLNSVTDHLWSALANYTGYLNSARVNFPRHEEKENIIDAFNRNNSFESYLKSHFPNIEMFVLETVKPYKVEKDEECLIWHLNKLDNIIKHRRLLLSYHALKFLGLARLIGADGGKIEISHSQFNFSGSIFPFGLTPPIKWMELPTIRLDIVLAESGHFNGKSIVNVLRMLHQCMDEFIIAFELEFKNK